MNIRLKCKGMYVFIIVKQLKNVFFAFSSKLNDATERSYFFAVQTKIFVTKFPLSLLMFAVHNKTSF